MTTEPTAPIAPTGEIEALVFDVVGTLVDEVGSLRRETREVFGGHGIDEALADAVADRWAARCEERLWETADGKVPWAPDEEIRRGLLPAVLDEYRVALPDAALDRLSRAGHRLTPWPGVPEQLGTLAALVTVTGLSNASLAQLTGVSALGGLRWHALLSTELAHTVKPDPASYRLPVDLLGLVPERTLFVAAHPWDLRGAAAQGYRTALLPRQYADPPKREDRFTLTLGSLDELAVILDR